MKTLALVITTLLGISLAPAAAAEPTGHHDAATSMPCGFHKPSTTAYYNHCGPTMIWITVEFFWGGWKPGNICVKPGVTNLSANPAMDGLLITYAYYNGEICRPFNGPISPST